MYDNDVFSAYYGFEIYGKNSICKKFLCSMAICAIFNNSSAFWSFSRLCRRNFCCKKNSKIYAYSTIAGAAVNIILNIILIRPFGALGAAIATAVCYAVIYWVRIRNALKYIKLRLNLKRDIIVYTMLYVQSVLFLVYTTEYLTLYIIQSGIFLIISCCFHKEFKELTEKIILMVRGYIDEKN